MLSESNLLAQSAELIPEEGTIYSLYCDPAYFLSPYLLGGILQPPPGNIKAAWNTNILMACIMVEWTFGEVGTHFQQLNLKQALMLYKFPVA
jgi:hypothetical protein